jgi:hypothetical protein
MTRKQRSFIRIAILAVLAGLLSAPAFAGAITLTLDTSSQMVSPGNTISYYATVSAPITNLALVYLNSDSLSVDYPLAMDDTPFLTRFPLTLAPGESFHGKLFDVTVPSYTTPAVYSGYFEIDGGADSGTLNTLTSVDFNVVVTPEPGTAMLLTAALGLAISAGKKRFVR